MATDLRQTDLLAQIYAVGDTGYEVVRTERGWVGRRTPVGKRRTARLTPPCDEPEDAVTIMRRRGHLPPKYEPVTGR